MSRKRRKTDPVVLLLDLIIIAMIYATISMGISLFQNVSHGKKTGSFMQDATRMTYDIEKKDYASLIMGAYVNKINDYNDTAQYHELASYTEAAFLYKVYEGKGKKEEANRQKMIMVNSRGSMGNMTIFADKVDEMLRDFGNK